IPTHASVLEQAGQKRQSLLPDHLDPCDMSVGSIDGLRLSKPGKGSAGDRGLYVFKDRVRQMFVKNSKLDRAHGMQVAFEEQIKVLSMGWLQIGVSDADCVPPVLLQDEGRQITEVWP